MSLEIHGYPWMSKDIPGNPWISRFIFVTKWHAAWVERFSARPISMICSCATCESRDFHVFRSVCVYWSLLLISCWGELWTTKDHLGGNWCLQEPFWGALNAQMTFRKIPKSCKLTFPTCPVTVFDQTVRNRCAIAPGSFSSHRLIKN